MKKENRNEKLFYVELHVSYIPTLAISLATVKLQIGGTAESLYLLKIQMVKLNPQLPVTVPPSQITAVVLPW